MIQTICVVMLIISVNNPKENLEYAWLPLLPPNMKFFPWTISNVCFISMRLFARNVIITIFNINFKYYESNLSRLQEYWLCYRINKNPLAAKYIVIGRGLIKKNFFPFNTIHTASIIIIQFDFPPYFLYSRTYQ